MSYSGLDVRSGETLVGLWIVYQGVESTTQWDVNAVEILQSGTGWNLVYALSVAGGGVNMNISSLVTFDKNGETAGTLTLGNQLNFIDGEYRVAPIVASLS